MKAQIVLALVMLMSVLYGEDKNPLIPEAAKPAEEQIQDPAITADERSRLTAYSRAFKDKNKVEGEIRDKAYEARDAVFKRIASAPLKWSEDDFKARVKTYIEMVDYRVSSSTVAKPFTEAVYNFVSHKDDNSDNFVKRIRLAESCYGIHSNAFKWRVIVNKFLENDKYKNATAQQRYDFVHGWLRPKVPAAAASDVEDLAKDLKADLANAKP